MTTSSLFPSWASLSCHPDRHSTFYMWSHGGNRPGKHGSNYTWLLPSDWITGTMGSLFIVHFVQPLSYKWQAWLVDMPYNRFDLKPSDYLLKAIQVTSSSFRKLDPNQNFTGQAQEELVMVFSSLISTRCACMYITGAYWDVEIMAWWALESDRFGTKFLSLIICETQSMQFNVYTTHQKT